MPEKESTCLIPGETWEFLLTSALARNARAKREPHVECSSTRGGVQRSGGGPPLRHGGSLVPGARVGQPGDLLDELADDQLPEGLEALRLHHEGAGAADDVVLEVGLEAAGRMGMRGVGGQGL